MHTVGPELALLPDELVALVRRVFVSSPADRRVAILVDFPDAALADNPRWAARRSLAAAWAEILELRSGELGLEGVRLVLYRNVRANNAELPARVVVWDKAPLPAHADFLPAPHSALEDVLSECGIVIAPTELSATAPLKKLAAKLGFRAATMPGFTVEMIPALRLDYEEIGRRVMALTRLQNAATRCDLVFAVGQRQHALTLDLRFRFAHASTGLLRERGTAGNLPSGEAYIVPYEGERAGEPSQSEGELPVELDGEVVVYRIEHNRAVAVLTEGKVSAIEAARLRAEPAYGNLAELGLGVLGEMGVAPCGEVLLDEKLGLHIAFGRSDHFGGQVGPGDFSCPEAVVHLDRVYIEALQPKIIVAQATLVLETGESVLLMHDGQYAAVFG